MMKERIKKIGGSEEKRIIKFSFSFPCLTKY